ncbi:MAG TPA: class I SAM-dependent methyltransferase [Gaiellaceae bacterium]|nr:class I SAM-dependent methyltransferase [Gaiellaceae bacterium]
MSVDFDDRLWKGYREGRTLPPSSMDAWMDAVERYADARRPLAVLDLGSGTGRFTPSLAERFGGPVYGVEPAANMRRVAVGSSPHPAVTYLDGRAEQIPLPDGSCDLAFLFFVYHHFGDRGAAASELARVLRPGAVICMRTQFGDRLRDVSWRRYFPRALEVERSTFPSYEESTAPFVRRGFELVALDAVEFEVASSVGAHLERLRCRAISTLELLTEDEVEAGFAAMERAAAEDTGGQPVREVGDLLVLRRQGDRGVNVRSSS